ncbi:MAG: hypothetical protein ACI82I_000496 [Gammaproteobacteria bacterium]|jgi:hypothetical protein
MRDLEIGKIKGHWHRAQLVKSGINIGCGATDTDKDHALKYPHQASRNPYFDGSNSGPISPDRFSATRTV